MLPDVMARHRARPTVHAAVLAAALLLAPTQGAAAAPASCPHLEGVALPRAGNTGSWDGNVLTMIDVASGSLLRYTPDRYLGQKQTRALPGLQAYRARAIGDSPSGPILQTTSGRFAVLNDELHAIGMFGLHRLDRDEPGATGRAYAWRVDGDRLVFCGSLRRDGEWESGYFRSPLDDMAAATPLSDNDNADHELIYCRTGYRFFTEGADGWVYLLRGEDSNGDGQEEATHIHAYQFEDDRLVAAKSFPTDFGRRAKLEQWRMSADEFAAAFSTIEKAERAPLGLFASPDGDWLFVVERTRKADGTVQWAVQAVDAVDGTVRGSAVLPSTSAHLSIIPGPRWVALLEKDAARSFEDHSPVGLSFVPMSSLEAIGSRGGNGQPLCDD